MSNGLGERTPSRTVHGAFERCAAAFPHAPAVSIQGTELSYAELDAHANQLAHHLGRLGVSSEDPIALCLERSVDLFVGLLAVLKAGCSYLALDRRAPQEWQARLLRIAGVKLVLTLSEDAERIPGVATPVPLTSSPRTCPGCPLRNPLRPWAPRTPPTSRSLPARPARPRGSAFRIARSCVWSSEPISCPSVRTTPSCRRAPGLRRLDPGGVGPAAERRTPGRRAARRADAR